MSAGHGRHEILSFSAREVLITSIDNYYARTRAASSEEGEAELSLWNLSQDNSGLHAYISRYYVRRLVTSALLTRQSGFYALLARRYSIKQSKSPCRFSQKALVFLYCDRNAIYFALYSTRGYFLGEAFLSSIGLVF